MSSSSNPNPNSSTSVSDEWVCIGSASKYGERTSLRVHGRQVTLIRLRLSPIEWTCVDSICYHAGGPLMQGPLKQVGNRTCVSCPWHSYLVDVRTGEGLYMDMSRHYASKGVRQRVHSVKLDTSNNHLYVKLNNNGSVVSDEYAYTGRYYRNGSPVQTCDFPDW